jgi:GNAT superfamily N-acetyltransferase
VIRGYQPGDLRALYQVCLQTGDSGRDATAQFRDPDLLGHVYAAPYGVLEPELAFVVEDQAGVGGYCLGALDSRAFERRLERDWWPPLRQRYPEPDPAGSAHWTRDEQVADKIHHPWVTDQDLIADYPSHLHIDLVPRFQGGGNGRQLMELQLAALRDRGSRGVHLGARAGNQRGQGFFSHLGFSRLSADDEFHVFGMRLA